MQFRNYAVVAVALLVLLSGCGAFGVTQSDEPSNGTDVEGDNAENGSTTDDGDETDGEGDDTDHEDETTDSEDESTANAEWNPPAEPNRPLEDKREDRIKSVEFVDKEPAANGDGYSNFNLEVVANTSMENVDPPEHGNVIGEPYFFVKINEDEQKLIERTGQVSMDENGTYHIEVRPAGIEEFGDGPLTVEVFLMDEDKDWDDIYDAVGQEIHFNPDSDGDAEEETDSETTEN
ncbi:hypothetical protein [Natronorubrum halophilum]|uniref:hypothetical protein n=1 Tax=Natronorubrum halophilum TaxID=1702106 RepID=UPI0010C1B96D|nr:hypothetical protein [Natronorubrum halophilum]